MDVLKKDLTAFAEFLKNQHKIDFTDYAMSSFKRRIERILEVEEIDSLEVLKSKFSNKEFKEKFVNEVTVNTTEFFRDPKVWAAINDVVIPKLKDLEHVRVLHAACSSGQEVYSFAVKLKENELLINAKIRAVDLNPEMLEVAKQGKYPKRLLEDSRTNYQEGTGTGSFDDYCSTEKFYLNMDTSLIKDVSFCQLNLVTDPLLGEYDIIFIRNVLIYFNQTLQDLVLTKICERMKPGAFLVVGAKETIAWCSIASSFKTIDTKNRIYIKL